MPTVISAAQLKLIFPAAAPEYLKQVSDELNNNPAAFSLDTAQRCAHFFAQVRQEAGPGLDAMTESLAYSPEALVTTFGYYKNHPAEAKQDGYDKDPATRKIRRPAAQQTIGNKAYGGRNGNGDVASGDGWLFRGRGFIQVTGRSNYADIGKQCKALFPGMMVDFVANPDAVASFPGSLRSAVGYWILRGLHNLADKGVAGADVDRITTVINSKTDSYADRRANFALALNAFK